jgi:hypothetical protein
MYERQPMRLDRTRHSHLNVGGDFRMEVDAQDAYTGCCVRMTVRIKSRYKCKERGAAARERKDGSEMVVGGGKGREMCH